METFEEQIFPAFKDALMSSEGDSLASLSVRPGSEKARVMTETSGRQCALLSNLSGQFGAFVKTCLGCSAWGNSMEYVMIWKISAINSRSLMFQLTALEPSTCDIGYSLLPTPRKEGFDSQGAGHGDLQYEVKQRLWRTPNARDAKGGATDGERRLEQGHQLNLQEQAITPKLWPTPTERDWKSCSHATKDNSRPLSEVAGQDSLNPEFVEWLMMFPLGHTRLSAAECPTVPPSSKPLATP